jgi:glutamate-1-semialdehyde 2,1-aminomutase
MNYSDACKIMPGGNGLLSKRPQLKSDNYPMYYEFAKGCEVWTEKKEKFRDFHLMGIGACACGYANPEIDNPVIEAIKLGNMTSINCPEEYDLAEALLKLNPEMEMVRFSRLGCDAMSQAVRVARAYTGKSKILYFGYHGWHDWYMAAGSNGQPNAGIPKCLKKKISEFTMDADLENVAGIVLEPALFCDEKLEEINRMSYDAGVPMIYDEITSGFREYVGGLYLNQKHNWYPDMVVYGKALGNGYPICAILGDEDIMGSYNDTFVSSTFNTERTGFVAGLATLDFMVKNNVPETLMSNGRAVKQIWMDAATDNNIELSIRGIDPLATFGFKDDMEVNNSNSLRVTYSSEYAMTVYQQEMVNKGFLAGSQYYASYAHKLQEMRLFSDAVHQSFKDLKSGHAKLKGRVASAGVRHG